MAKKSYKNDYDKLADDVYNKMIHDAGEQNTGDVSNLNNPTGIHNPADYIFNMEEFSKDLSSALDTRGNTYGKVYGGDAANELKKNRNKKKWGKVALTAAVSPFGMNALIGGIGSAVTEKDAKSKAYFSDYIKRYLPDEADQRDFYNKVFNVLMEKGDSITRSDIERIQNEFIASGKADKDFDLSGGRMYGSFIKALKAAIPNMQQKYNKETGFVKPDGVTPDNGGVVPPPGGVVPPDDNTPPAGATGKRIANTNKAVAAANPGDWLIRNDGTKIVVWQGDINWAKQHIAGESKPTAAPKVQSVVSNTDSESQNQEEPIVPTTPTVGMGTPATDWKNALRNKFWEDMTQKEREMATRFLNPAEIKYKTNAGRKSQKK